MLSSLFGDVTERGLAAVSPIRSLPKSTHRLYRPAHDPRTTPFVERVADVRRIFVALGGGDSPVGVAYALGALVGLRTGEVLALRWGHVDLATRRIHVRESIGGPLKDNDSRVVPILEPLFPVLRDWKLRTGGTGRVVPPLRSDGQGLDAHTVNARLRNALPTLELPPLTWYQATRHTFASQWVLGGGSIEKLREVLGHCSVLVTERYAHLRVDLFAERDFATIGVDLRPGGTKPVQMSTEQGLSASVIG
jgi:integrase